MGGCALQAKIMIRNMETARSEMEVQARELAAIASDLEDVRSTLQSDYYGVGQVLKRIQSSVNSEQRKLDMFGDGVRKIESEYFRAEEAIVSGIVACQAQSVNASSMNVNKSEKDAWFNEVIKKIFKSFGAAGSVFGIVSSIFGAKTWTDWGKVGVDTTKAISKIARDYNRYNKIGRALGTTNANGYFWRNFFGFNKVGRASTASSASARFYNNLHNITSPYKISGIFDSFMGKKGGVSCVASWAGLVLSGFSNRFSNIEEQRKSNGTMSDGRVIAETISETVIDTVITAGSTAVVGAAIATVTGAVAAPAVVAIAAGIAVWGIQTGCEAVFGVSATEAISDLALNTISAVGNTVADGAKAVANWFGKLSFA